MISSFPSYLLCGLPNRFQVGWCAYYQALLALDGMQKNISPGGCLAYSVCAKVNLACSNSCTDIHKLSHHNTPTLWVQSRSKMVHYRLSRLVHKFREGFISCCFSSTYWWLDFTNRLPFGLHHLSSASLPFSSACTIKLSEQWIMNLLYNSHWMMMALILHYFPLPGWVRERW